MAADRRAGQLTKVLPVSDAIGPERPGPDLPPRPVRPPRSEPRKAAPEPQSQPAGPERRRGRLLLVLAVVLPATFMQLLDASIVSIAVPPLQADLGATYSELQLVVGGYLL